MSWVGWGCAGGGGEVWVEWCRCGVVGVGVWMEDRAGVREGLVGGWDGGGGRGGGGNLLSR